MKPLSKTLLAVYLLILLWLVLFKFTTNVVSILDYSVTRSVNLIPFANYSSGTAREMIYNFLVFIPFGLLLSLNFKHTSFWRKLTYVFIFSIAVEIIQLVFGIGVTDITDIITNTVGGLIGLLLYQISDKVADTEKLDRLMVIGGMVALMIFTPIAVILLASDVRYQKPPANGVHLQRTLYK